MPHTSPEIPLRGPVPLAHLMLRQFVHTGDTVVDATCGNGNDTLLLAELVGATGRVWAFDIQATAIGHTARKLVDAGWAERAELVHGGHEAMAERVPDGVGAVVFNLGYLPGGDRTIITKGAVPGDTVITDGHVRLAPNSPVEVKGAQADQGKSS